MLKVVQRLRSAMAPDLNRSDLLTLLQELNPEFNLKRRITALRNIMEWIRLPVKVPADSDIPDHIYSRNIRLKFFFQFLERNPNEAAFFAENIKKLMRRGSAVKLYCLTGISENTGFFSELSGRITQSIIPYAFSENDSVEIFKIIFNENEDAEWIENSYETVLPLFNEFLDKHSINTEGITLDQNEALIILGSQIAAMGISRDIRSKIENKEIIESNFLKLNMLLNRREQHSQVILLTVKDCRKDLEQVKKDIETSGVSVALIYAIERMTALLDRIELIIYLRETKATQTRLIIVSQFITHLIRDELKTREIKAFLYEHLHMLTRKIVECAGEKGGHYIASTKEGRHDLFNASAWAGVLTAFTAILKSWIGQAHFPIGIEGFFFFINYAIGFLLMQRWHLALSSKQPAYMASALSKKFEVFVETKDLREVTLEVRNITYSQIIATIGNLLYVIPLTVALDSLWNLALGRHIVDVSYAHKIIKSHDLLSSMTLFYAILTGVLLFLSSAIAGWVENWMAFRNIPFVLQESSFLNNFFGQARMKKFAKHAASTIGGIAGNVSIAFLLASPIIIGKFTGIPLDIRHVTLATGTIALAFNSLGWNIELWPQIISMILSILIIGICNFGVSFYLALKMASIARNVNSRHLKTIFKFAFKRR